MNKYSDGYVPRSAQKKFVEDIIGDTCLAQGKDETRADYLDRFEKHYGFRPAEISGDQLLQKLQDRKNNHEKKLQRAENRDQN
jgi:hypothetical protein